MHLQPRDYVPADSPPTQTVMASSSTTASSTITAAPTSGTSTAASAGPTSYTISVGASGHANQYYPPYLDNVNVGDKLIFEYEPSRRLLSAVLSTNRVRFYPTNHSVVRSAFGSPCIPYEDVVQGGHGFFSQPFLVDNQFQVRLPDTPLLHPPNRRQKPQWTYTLDTTDPLFFYCTAIDSCLKNGMVGAINPNATQTFAAQQAAAMSAPYMLVPGQPFPAEGTPAPSPSLSPAPTTHLGAGAIAGIAVGAVAGIALLAALCFLLGRNKVYAKWVASERGDATARTTAWLAGAKPGPWGSDVASSRAPDDAAQLQAPPHMSMSPPASWRGSPPPQSGARWQSMYGPPGGPQGGWMTGGYAPVAPVAEVHEVPGEVPKGAQGGVYEISSDPGHR